MPVVGRLRREEVEPCHVDVARLQRFDEAVIVPEGDPGDVELRRRADSAAEGVDVLAGRPVGQRDPDAQPRASQRRRMNGSDHDATLGRLALVGQGAELTSERRIAGCSEKRGWERGARRSAANGLPRGPLTFALESRATTRGFDAHFPRPGCLQSLRARRLRASPSGSLTPDEVSVALTTEPRAPPQQGEAARITGA